MIKVAYLHEKHEQATVLDRCVPQLRDLGIEIIRNPKQADIVVQHYERKGSLVDHPNIIILERLDGAQLYNNTRKLLNTEKIIGVIKHARFTKLEDYNKVYGRYHIYKLSGDMEHESLEHIDNDKLGRIFLGWNFGSYIKHDRIDKIDINYDDNRTIDVSFIGSHHKQPDIIKNHRKTAFNEVIKLNNSLVGNGLVLGRTKYIEALLLSKIVVCPWGWGEYTHREYEAVLAGCLVIKPRTDFSTDSQHPGGFYWCEPDFSDLTEVVANALESWPDVKRRQEARDKLQRMRTRESIASNVATMLKGVI